MKMELNFEAELHQSKQMSSAIIKLINNMEIHENNPIFKSESNKLCQIPNPQELLNLQMFADNNQKLVTKFDGISREQKTISKDMDCLNKKGKVLELQIESLKQEKATLSNSTKTTRRALQTAINKYKQIFNTHIENIEDLTNSTFKIKVHFNNQHKDAAINLIIDKSQRQIIDFEEDPSRPLINEEKVILKKYLDENSKNNNFSVFGSFLRNLLLSN